MLSISLANQQAHLVYFKCSEWIPKYITITYNLTITYKKKLLTIIILNDHSRGNTKTREFSSYNYVIFQSILLYRKKINAETKKFLNNM